MQRGSNTHEIFPILKEKDAFVMKLKNNGSASLMVDGSVTPVSFTLEDATFTNFGITRFDYALSSTEIISLDGFGSNGALTNGLIFQAGEDEIIVKTNGDLLLLGTDNDTSSSKIESSTIGLINGNYSFIDAFGAMLETNVNSFKVIVQDDLTNNQYFQISVSGVILDD